MIPLATLLDVDKYDIPRTTIGDAMASPYASFWQDAVNEELAVATEEWYVGPGRPTTTGMKVLAL